MSRTNVTYRPLAVGGPTKSGIMKPDANGYYDVVLGGLNTFNASGIWYTMEHSAAMFQASSSFQRNVREGTIYSENGHPVRQPGMSDDAWVERFLGLQENRFTNIISEVTLDSTYARRFDDPRIKKDTVIIMGKIKPAGELSYVLEDAIKNPKQNVCYSIRCITDTFTKGTVKVKVIRGVITFDLVYSGGLIFSKKPFHPSTESILAYDRKEINKILASMPEDKLHKLTEESKPSSEIIHTISEDIITPFESTPVFMGL